MGAPPSALWATDPAGFAKSAASTTAQGFEYDWSGVIIGPDLVWREKRLGRRPGCFEDPALRKGNGRLRHRHRRGSVDPQYIQGALDAGMVGTAIYSTDPETQAKLHELVEPGRSTAAALSAG